MTAHSVATAHEQGWSTLSNGDLLDAAQRVESTHRGDFCDKCVTCFAVGILRALNLDTSEGVGVTERAIDGDSALDAAREAVAAWERWSEARWYADAIRTAGELREAMIALRAAVAA